MGNQCYWSYRGVKNVFCQLSQTGVPIIDQTLVSINVISLWKPTQAEQTRYIKPWVLKPHYQHTDMLLISIVSTSMTSAGVTPSDTVTCHLLVHSRRFIFMSGWWFPCSGPIEKINKWQPLIIYIYHCWVRLPILPQMTVCTLDEICIRT